MFDSLTPEEQVSYLQDCLPIRPYEEVVSNFDSYSEETVSALLSEGKRVLVAQMEQGRDQWRYLIENMDYSAEGYLEEHSYRELAYYLTAMGDSGLGTFPIPFSLIEESRLQAFLLESEDSVEEIRDYLIENGPHSVEKSFSKAGTNIWDNLGEDPTPRIAYFEDSQHLYIEFWLRTASRQRFHERRGEFLEFPVLRKVVCRIHLDDEFIELRGRKERKKDRENSLVKIKRFLNDDISYRSGNNIATDGGDDFAITDDSIRYFYTLPEFQRLSHANKDGTARSSWTAEDVRNDTMFPDNRPNNYNNLVFRLDSVGRVSFQLNAEDNSYQIFKHKIMPGDHRTVSEYIWEKLNNVPN